MRADKKIKNQLMGNSSESSQMRTGLKVSNGENMRPEEILKESEKILHRSFASSRIGTAVFDLDGNYIEVNEAYTKILGIPKKELLGRLAIELTEVKEPKETSEDITEILTSGITGGVTEIKIHDKNLVLSYVDTLLYDQEEKPVGIISMIQDITELSGPQKAISEGREYTEKTVKKVSRPSVEFDSELKEIPAKRRFFNPFKIVPRKMEQEMIYDMEESSPRTSRLRGFFGRFIHKNLELDRFLYELEAETFWRRKLRNDEDFLGDEDD